MINMKKRFLKYNMRQYWKGNTMKIIYTSHIEKICVDCKHFNLWRFVGVCKGVCVYCSRRGIPYNYEEYKIWLKETYDRYEKEKKI